MSEYNIYDRMRNNKILTHDPCKRTWSTKYVRGEDRDKICAVCEHPIRAHACENPFGLTDNPFGISKAAQYAALMQTFQYIRSKYGNSFFHELMRFEKKNETMKTLLETADLLCYEEIHGFLMQYIAEFCSGPLSIV